MRPASLSRFSLVAMLAAGAALTGTVLAVESTSRPIRKIPTAQSASSLKADWKIANEGCQGGNVTSDDQICKNRDAIQRRLERLGWCWDYADWRVSRVDYNWHKCSELAPVGWKPEPIVEESSDEPSPPEPVLVTRAQFYEVHLGMYYPQIQKIMGSPGVEQSSYGGELAAPMTTITWRNPDGSYMALTFEGEMLVGKTQSGL